MAFFFFSFFLSACFSDFSVLRGRKTRSSKEVQDLRGRAFIFCENGVLSLVTIYTYKFFAGYFCFV